jgi:hypothetical protein
MNKISGQNYTIRFFCKYLAIGRKTSKTVIAPEGRPISPYPFELFLVSPGPTYRQNITSKAFYHLVEIPR